MKLDKTSFEVYKAIIKSWFILTWIMNMALIFEFTADFILFLDIILFVILNLIWAIMCVVRS